MNGWSVEATMSSAVGDGFGVRVYNGSHYTVANVYVSAVDTLRLVVNGNDAGGATFNVGSVADPTATVTTGGNLDVQILCDVDAPVGAATTYQFYVGGSLVGSVVGTTALLNDYPAGRPERVRTWQIAKTSAATVSGIAATRWDNDVMSPVFAGTGTGRFTQVFNLLPPLGHNPVTFPDGSQYITRPGGRSPATAAGGLTKLWRRSGPYAEWAYLSEVWDTDTRPNPLVASRPGLLFNNVRGIDLVTGAFSTTVADTPYGELLKQFWFGYGEPLEYDGLFDETPTADQFQRLAPSAVCYDPADGLSMAVKYTQHDDEERVYVVPGWEWADIITPGSTQVRKARRTVASGVRTAGNDDSRPHPWIWRSGGGRWVVGWFANDAYREFTSDGVNGRAWTETTPATAQTWTAGAGNYAVTNHCRGRGGVEAVAGYHYGDAEFTTMVRSGPGAAWDGPYTIAASATAAAPYLVECPDGTWEAGWLIGGSWARYTAPTPVGPWTVAA